MNGCSMKGLYDSIDEFIWYINNRKVTERYKMREYLFRAWSRQHKCMFYSDEHDVLFYSFGGYSLGEFSENEGGYKVVVNDAHSVLMQYTGIKDKSGKKIYDGDVVKCDYPKNHPDITSEVVWEKSGWFLVSQYHQWEGQHDSYRLFDGAQFKVIGNRFENPELVDWD